MRPTILASLCAAALGLAACAPDRAPQPAQLLVTIDGMHCEDCAIGITKSLAAAHGVLATDVHFSNRVQTIQYDAARQKPERIVTLITDAGYKATPVPADASRAGAEAGRPAGPNAP